MTTERSQIVVRGIPVEVVRKDIKHLHLGVYPPRGRVRVAAPSRLKDDAVRLAIVTRLGWIRRQRDRFEKQERQSEREMATGETHYFQGRRYRLLVVEGDGPAAVTLRNNHTMQLRVPSGAGAGKRRAILEAWYRAHLHAKMPALVAKWEPIARVRVAEWRIKKMKTRWGTCNAAARRVWLNLELAKKPTACLEFILVHEMVHLVERHHNERFQKRMDELMPTWRRHRAELNRAPLAYEAWSY